MINSSAGGDSVIVGVEVIFSSACSMSGSHSTQVLIGYGKDWVPLFYQLCRQFEKISNQDIGIYGTATTPRRQVSQNACYPGRQPCRHYRVDENVGDVASKAGQSARQPTATKGIQHTEALRSACIR